MTTAITRSELFELVWSEPRTTLAKRFKLSDVAIGKHCRKANIPMPPPGYWARKLAGKTSTRPPLPLRLPGQRDQVFPGEEDRYGYFNRTEGLEEILLPPVFPESAQLLVADAANRIGNIRACRDLSNPHPGLKRVLADENRRHEAWAAQKYADYYKPYFDAPNLQRQLRLINSILWGFDRIDCKGEAYITEEWVRAQAICTSFIATSASAPPLWDLSSWNKAVGDFFDLNCLIQALKRFAHQKSWLRTSAYSWPFSQPSGTGFGGSACLGYVARFMANTANAYETNAATAITGCICSFPNCVVLLSEQSKISAAGHLESATT